MNHLIFDFFSSMSQKMQKKLSGVGGGLGPQGCEVEAQLLVDVRLSGGYGARDFNNIFNDMLWHRALWVQKKGRL